MNNKIIISVIIVAAVVLGIFVVVREPPETQIESQKASEQQSASFKTLTSTELASRLGQKDFSLINVHIPYEGEIENTDAFIPYDKIADNLGKLPKDKNAKIVLYCKSGRMSEIAAGELAKQGYTQVAHLNGGMIDWEAQEYKIIRK